MIIFTAGERDGGRELLRILRGELRLSAGLVRKLKDRGGIFVNSRPAFTNYRLNPGDVVSVDELLAEEKSDLVPELGEVRVLYEDSWCLALDKPAGLLTHPSRARYTGTLANFAAEYLGGTPCHAVNRLDRDTTGIVLFAKSAHAKARFSEALSIGTKTYLAAVCGVPEPASGTMDAPIRRLNTRDMRRIAAEDGERAVTHYELLGTARNDGDTAAILRLALETGRTHQIRVHCLHYGYPVLGDRLYADERSQALSEKLGIMTQVLHAHTLVFTHPFTGARTELQCQPEGVLKRLMIEAEISGAGCR